LIRPSRSVAPARRPSRNPPHRPDQSPPYLRHEPVAIQSQQRDQLDPDLIRVEDSSNPHCHPIDGRTGQHLLEASPGTRRSDSRVPSPLGPHQTSPRMWRRTIIPTTNRDSPRRSQSSCTSPRARTRHRRPLSRDGQVFDFIEDGKRPQGKRYEACTHWHRLRILPPLPGKRP
jgi:hypothetical protein